MARPARQLWHHHAPAPCRASWPVPLSPLLSPSPPIRCAPNRFSFQPVLGHIDPEITPLKHSRGRERGIRVCSGMHPRCRHRCRAAPFPRPGRLGAACGESVVSAVPNPKWLLRNGNPIKVLLVYLSSSGLFITVQMAATFARHSSVLARASPHRSSSDAESVLTPARSHRAW